MIYRPGRELLIQKEVLFLIVMAKASNHLSVETISVNPADFKDKMKDNPGKSGTNQLILSNTRYGPEDRRKA